MTHCRDDIGVRAVSLDKDAETYSSDPDVTVIRDCWQIVSQSQAA